MKVVGFWVVISCSDVGILTYRFTLRIEAVGPPKQWYPTTPPHGVTTQKTTCIFITVKISNLTFIFGDNTR